MKPSAAQDFIVSRLSTCTALGGIPIMRELPATATPDQLAAAEKTFEGHIATEGIVLVVLKRRVGQAAGTVARGAFDVMTPVAICENPEVNRRAGGLNKNVDVVADDVVGAVLCDLVTFGAAPVVDPQPVEGLSVSYVQPFVRCTVKASGDTAPSFVPPVR